MSATLEKRLRIRDLIYEGVPTTHIVKTIMRDFGVGERTVYDDLRFVREGGLERQQLDELLKAHWRLYYKNLNGTPQQSVAIKALENITELSNINNTHQEKYIHVSSDDIELAPWAKEAFDNYGKYPIANFLGGRGRAASRSLAKIVAFKAMLGFGHSGIVAREYQESISKSNINIIKGVIEEEPRYRDYFDTTKKDKIICTLNGAVAEFNGIRNKLNSWRSIEGYQWYHFEEAKENTEEQWQVILPSLRDDDLTVFASWNPEYEDDPVNQLLEWEGAINEFRTYKDNPYFPDVLEKQRLRDKKIYSPEVYEHIWLGKYKPQDGTAMFHYKIVDKIYNSDIDSHIGNSAGLDVAGSEEGDWTAIIVLDENGDEVYSDRIREPNFRKRVEWERDILLAYECYNVTVDVTGGYGKSDMDELRECGIAANPFVFNRTSKMDILTKLGKVMADKEIGIKNPDIIKELKDLGDDGKALKEHDDYVMALALAVQGKPRDVHMVDEEW